MDLQKELIESGINKKGLKAILVPTDFSENSDMALQAAIDIAEQQNARIYLLHTTRTQQIAAEKETIRAQIDKFHDAKLIEIIPDIRRGDPYEEILKVHAEKEIDLIVIASHGKGLSHLRARNVARKVTKSSKCSVLVVGD